MKDPVKSSIEGAKAKLVAQKVDHQTAEETLVREVAVVERHSSLLERLASAQSGYEALSATLEERYSADPIPNFAAQLATDSTRLNWLAGQLAGFEAVKNHVPEIVAEYRRCTVDILKSDLATFEAEHAAVLKKHGAI